jgi:hypothetical protein
MSMGMDAFSNVENKKATPENSSEEVDSSRVNIMDLFGNASSNGSEQKAETTKSAPTEQSADRQVRRRRRTLSTEQPANEQVSRSEDSGDIKSAASMFNRTQKEPVAEETVTKDAEDVMPTEIKNKHINVRKDDGFVDGRFQYDMEDATKQEAPAAEKPKEQKKVKQDEKITLFRHTSPSVYKVAIDVMKYKALERRFTKGRLIMALDEDSKPLMYLYQSGNELMAYKYLGTSLDVRIPAYVGNLPVRYIHGKMFTSAVSIVDRNGMRNLKENLTGKDVINVNMQKVKESFGGLKSVVLPETLVELPARLFYHCYSITEVVIPASVTNISKWFLYSSGIKNVYFNGTCPESFHNCSVSQDIFVHISA